jgi:hypothetical protein
MTRTLHFAEKIYRSSVERVVKNNGKYFQKQKLILKKCGGGFYKRNISHSSGTIL